MISPIASPEWPTPPNIKAYFTFRHGGFSQGDFTSFNLAHHVEDDPQSVNKNRQLLYQLAELPEEPRWLRQTHSNKFVNSNNWQQDIEADAIISQRPRHVCPILTADCLPILLCNKQGTAVAAIHAGWRGLAKNIIEQTIEGFPAKAKDIIVWLGPAIGPNKFEVGHDVYQVFTQDSHDAKLAFAQTDEQHFLANIYLLAKQRLQGLGISAIYGGDFCTHSETSQFFSYRRDGRTGRMASLIWFDAN